MKGASEKLIFGFDLSIGAKVTPILRMFALRGRAKGFRNQEGGSWSLRCRFEIEQKYPSFL